MSHASASSASRVEVTPGGDQPRLLSVPLDGGASDVVQALVAAGFVSKTDLRRVDKIRQEPGEERSSLELLVALGLVADTDLANTAAATLGIPKFDSADLAQPAESPVPIARRFLQEHLVVPVTAPDGKTALAMMDPCEPFLLDIFKLCLGAELQRAVASRSDIEWAIEQHFGTERHEANDSDDDEAELADLDVEQLKDMASEAPVIRLVNQLLQKAKEACASDIHIEPFETQLKVRYRIDGVLHDVDAPPQHLAPAVISRIKIMAKLNIAERRLPQDGRTKLKIQGSDIDARVSTIPTMYGESVVLRLLNRGDVKLDLASLGFSPEVRDSFLNILRKPNGMILVTGPTGSGKTTTLYTAIDLLNTEARKIITAEDPVEYQMAGVNQIQVKPAIGLSFSSVLRSIVRQDPDVILVGEMRDVETAKICVQSALTGHLVLSTLHTNNAASSVARLLEMGIEEYLLTSTLNGVLSQRLVRMLCPKCRQADTPSAELIDDLRLRKVAGSDDIVLWQPVGCEECNGTGYRGRQSILELLIMTDDIRRLVNDRADARHIEEAAIRGGMRTIYEDGCAKALAGITSMDEVLRVIQDG